MRTTNVKDYRASLAGYHRSVTQDNDPLLVTGPKNGDVVVISREDFENLELCLKISRDKILMSGIDAAQKRLDGKLPSFAKTEEAFADLIKLEH